MAYETPAYPHTLAQWVWLIAASALGYVGSVLKEWISKKRSPAEEAKTYAEARQIDTATNRELMQAIADAFNKSCRLEDERDHWKRKAETVQFEHDQAVTRADLNSLQMRKMQAWNKTLVVILEERKIPYPDWDGKT